MKYFNEMTALDVIETFGKLAYLTKITALQDYGLVAEFEVLITRTLLTNVVPDHITDMLLYSNFDIDNKRIYIESPKGDNVLTLAFEADVTMEEFANRFNISDLQCILDCCKPALNPLPVN